jgi:hypothetical protein
LIAQDFDPPRGGVTGAASNNRKWLGRRSSS